jgi:hypothetical protein
LTDFGKKHNDNIDGVDNGTVSRRLYIPLPVRAGYIVPNQSAHAISPRDTPRTHTHAMSAVSNAHRKARETRSFTLLLAIIVLVPHNHGFNYVSCQVYLLLVGMRCTFLASKHPL